MHSDDRPGNIRPDGIFKRGIQLPVDKELAKKIEEFDGYIVKMIPTSSLEFIYCILLGERQHSVEGEFDDLYEPGEDFLSTSAMNFLLYHNDEPVGYIRLLASEKFFLLTHYYVEPKSRGRISLIFLRIVLSEFFKNDDVIRMTYHV